MLPSDPSHAGDDQDPLQPFDRLVKTLVEEPDQWALFLDIDGTLIDLAPSPDEIVVPQDLPGHLSSVSQYLGGALALVTGRALPYADELFQPHQFPIAGLHGSERRLADGTLDCVTATEALEEVKNALCVAAGRWPGILIEDKGAAVAAHYRQAPERRAELEEVMQYYLLQAGNDFTLQRGKMVFEIRPARADKGGALEAYLTEPPFKGRRPIAIGDDVTDEAMFKVVNGMNGRSIRVAKNSDGTEARSVIASAALVRDALAGIAEQIAQNDLSQKGRRT
ncbi:trehalose 6-phosphate phosphatase [Pseudorhizobium tarimense]|uniref:Trehalose 6-phosphate phosphatase n=1 Tax=Pseudorhizobium tarimense TaxID=1079109 RepID=A0ABV2H9R9_9HYPH|nr:trehalose-phosphatase [Pseudorhizobium tarimense]MCJ8520383.1 trehalose-phosphatase [Pseudorhizobium tarimense]